MINQAFNFIKCQIRLCNKLRHLPIAFQVTINDYQSHLYPISSVPHIKGSKWYSKVNQAFLDTVNLVEETLQCVILPLSSLLWWFHMCFLVMEMMSSLNLLVPGCVFKSAKKWVNVVKKCSSLYTWCVSLDIKNGQTQCHSTGLRYWFCSMSQFHFTYMHNIAYWSWKNCFFLSLWAVFVNKLQDRL